ncbi:SgcJ/EcaC family oxidoreductase [Amycolatopsis nigrescens]|uniref:SgcJ/EcaC family oxidoreductase n=1 Tax=Amycolatopsis nigrescens TaxID=381445 RepID=UPI000364B29E|nr:SgcJ/EcaC family oxidoreductase [Amycolatopsis nigrescens]
MTVTTSTTVGIITTTPSAGDQAAVASIPRRVIAAWAAHDANAFAELFTENGSMILPGQFQKGRAEIRAFMTAAFAGPYRDTRVTGSPVSVEFFSDEAGVLITEGGVLHPGETEVAGERAIRASWVVVKVGGQWLLAAYQNSPRGQH